MKYATVASGIEAPSVAWHNFKDWQPIFFSEIEPFPKAVLKYHYPTVPDMGDLTKFKEWKYGPGDIDLMIGGLPCQSFSLAGLRKGLDDPRGNLTLTYLAILDKIKPRFMIYENVPGLCSDKTGALKLFLDGLEEIGYVIDIDILDAQFFGVPQRRKRVFVCGERMDHILKMETKSSIPTLCQMFIEIFHGLLGQTLAVKSGKKKKVNDWDRYVNSEAIQKRIKLLLNGGLTRQQIRNRFARTILPFLKDFKNLVPESWAKDLEVSLPQEYKASDEKDTMMTEERVKSILKTTLFISRLLEIWDSSTPTWLQASESCLNLLKECIRYAGENDIKVSGNMGGVQPRSDFSWQAICAAESLEHIRNGITSQELCTLQKGLPGNPSESKQEGKRDSKNIGDGTTGSCGTIGASTGTNGGTVKQQDIDAGHVIAQKIYSMDSDSSNSMKSKNPESGFNKVETAKCLDTSSQDPSKNQGGIMVVVTDEKPLPTLTSKMQGSSGFAPHNETAHLLVMKKEVENKEPICIQGAGQMSMGVRGKGWKQDGTTYTLNKTEQHAVAFEPGIMSREGGHAYDELSGTIRKEPGDNSMCVAFQSVDHAADASKELSPTIRKHDPMAVAYRKSSRAKVKDGEETWVDDGIANTLNQFDTGERDTHAIVQKNPTMIVRRITPVEAEFLQGFPRDYTLIPFGKNGKMATDGHRYRALGNSMAVPCILWISERIQLLLERII